CPRTIPRPRSSRRGDRWPSPCRRPDNRFECRVRPPPPVTDDPRMHLVGLVKSPTHVCCRYRLAAFQPLLARAGHRLELRAWPSSWLAGLWFHRGLTQADAVVVQRRLLPGWQLARVRRGARKLIFDFDDAVFLRDSYSGRGLHSERRLEAFVRTLEAADAVVAGNAFLAEQAARWTAAGRV